MKRQLPPRNCTRSSIIIIHYHWLFEDHADSLTKNASPSGTDSFFHSFVIIQMIWLVFAHARYECTFLTLSNANAVVTSDSVVSATSEIGSFSKELLAKRMKQNISARKCRKRKEKMLQDAKSRAEVGLEVSLKFGMAHCCRLLEVCNRGLVASTEMPDMRPASKKTKILTPILNYTAVNDEDQKGTGSG